MNKTEALKTEKDGLDIQEDLVRFAREGWKTIGDDDKERLKWVGVFMRRPTPGHFMMRVRMPNGIVTTDQVRLLAQITRESGRSIADITTRQQLQLRWVTIERVPEIIARLEAAGLSSLQTGMDNIRGIIGCPATGLTPGELIDTAPIAREFQRIFLGNKEFTNLPRKFNVTITGCLEHCTSGETQDISMTPALAAGSDGEEIAGFNVAVGGKQGSGGPTLAASAVLEGLVDKIVLYIAPKLVGGEEAPGILGGIGLAPIDTAIDVEIAAVDRMGSDIRVEAYVHRDR